MKCAANECPNTFRAGWRIFRTVRGWRCWEHLTPEERKSNGSAKRPLTEREARAEIK